MEAKDYDTKEGPVEMYEHSADEAQHVQSDSVEYTDAEARAITRKIDFRLLPVLTLLYLLSFLDRGNVGNARALGMQKDLHLTDKQWNLCLTIFFFPYALLEVPSNIVLKILKPNIWLTMLIIAWGTVVVTTGIVHNYSGLLLARFFLGVTEAGFFPAATYLLTCWYKRHELQTRMAIFYSAGSMAGAFSGLLAYAINYMDGIAGLEGWRWIMILEGILTVVVGFLCPFILPNSPATASFLTAPEKAHIIRGLQNDSGSTGQVETSEKYHKRYIFAAIKDLKIYISVLIYWGNAISNYGFIYTLPTVIKQLGYTAANAQLLTIPVYAFALSTTVGVAFMSDKYKTRSPFIIGPFIVAAAGYIALIALPHPGLPGATYGMLFVVAGGLYPSICGVISWNANNLAGSWKRSVGMAIQISIGNLGGAIGSNIYLAKEAPHYWTGYGVSLTIITIGIVSTALLRFKLNRENMRREKMTTEEIKALYTEQELLELGDKSPLFRYTL
ncbi:retrograde regulation protein 2 [Paraphoma chrysanthemicola]|nr:retrograde regulation protein 2 [Paraphoma chrysanthemicola]